MHENLSQNLDDRKNISICRIMILHTRPEFADVEFLLIYHAREDRDEQSLKEIFARAFKQAHPQWQIKQIIVDMKHSQHTPENSSPDIRVMLPEDLPNQTI